MPMGSVLFVCGAKTTMWSKFGVSYSFIAGVLSPGARKVRLYPWSWQKVRKVKDKLSLTRTFQTAKKHRIICPVQLVVQDD